MNNQDYTELLKSAPIQELADYLGVSVDQAVQIRVAFAVDAARQMEVSVRVIEPRGNLYGFASVTMGGMTVDDFKIVSNKEGGLFVGMPSKADNTSSTGYRNTVHIDKDFREDFHTAVIGAYIDAQQELAQPSIAEQMQAAAIEAQQHNTEQSTKKKSKSLEVEHDHTEGLTVG